MGQDASKALDEKIFNLKLSAKQLARQSAKCEKQEKVERAAVKTAIEKGKNELAKIHAENSIRQKNQAINLLR
jgi:charged multivesicular body protein 1